MAITVKHTKVSTIPDDADTSLIRPSDWNAEHSLVGTVPIDNGGTGASTANDGFNALAPSQTGNSGKYLTTDGSNTSWATNPLGTVTNVSGTAPVNVATGTTTPVISLSSTGTGNVVLATGATQSNPIISNYEDFTSTTAPTYTEGRVWYDSTEKSLAFYNDSSALAVHVSQDLIVKVINNTGSTIANGSPVYVTGTSSGQTYPNVALAKADVASTSSVIGLTNGAIANGAIGYVTSQGTIDNVNTSTFTVGQVLYLSPYSAGQLMNTIPPTGITVQVGVVTFVNSTTGHIYVKQTTPLAVPASIITGTLGVDHGGTGAVTLTGYVKGSGTSALTASSTIPTTDLSGTITNAQLANSAITINGTSTSLGGSISVGTVTSVTGTAPVVSSGGNTPAISMPVATTSVSGYLSSTDWNTFNNKGSGTVTSVTATSPVTSTGGTTPVIAIPAATTSVSGYLTSTDWTTFNGKQATLVSGTNIKTVSGTSLLGSGDLGVIGVAYGGTGLSSTPTNGQLNIGNGTGFTRAALTAGTGISITNGSGSISIASTNGLSWQSVQTANFTAVSGNAYPVNTTSGAITVTLPASPTAGNFVTVVDYAGTAGTNNIIVAPNGSKIQGISANVSILVNRQAYNFVYIDSTQGWLSYAQEYTASTLSVTASYLIAAGGGGGSGAGGGAGGLLTGTVTLTPGTNYPVVVGAGGTAGSSSGTAGAGGGGAGVASTAFGLSTVGGGGGGANTRNGTAGGSGGGAGYSGSTVTGGAGTSGQGFAGGDNSATASPYPAAGGGGSSAVGANTVTSFAGNGGAGTVTTLITTSQATSATVGQVVSSSVYFTGGGGGSTFQTGGTQGTGGNGGGGAGVYTGLANSGATNSGGGGGGQGGAGLNGIAAGAGGSGCVIISVPTTNYSGTTTGSPTVVTNGSNTVMIFKSSGSYTA